MNISKFSLQLESSIDTNGILDDRPAKNDLLPLLYDNKFTTLTERPGKKDKNDILHRQF